MANIVTTQKESIVDQLEQLHQRIARRAYDLFRGRNGWGDAFGDWFSAERELVSKPAVEMREQDGTFTIAAALPGVDAKDITVDITPQDVVIKAATEHKHTEDKGKVHRCEFTSDQFFRSLQFPKAVDAAKAKADYQNGMLNITVPVAPETQRQASGHQSRVDATPLPPPLNKRSIASCRRGRSSRPGGGLQRHERARSGTDSRRRTSRSLAGRAFQLR